MLAGVLTPVPGDDAATVFADPAPAANRTPADATIAGDTTGLPPSAGGVRQAASPKNATGPLQIGQQFSPRYIIVRLLGIGGMGAVYQAWDGVLSVMVALKVIRPEVTSDPAAAREIERRFKQELLLARQVTHKNVVRIHDMGEIDGIKYITMSYIEGEDLTTALKKAGKLPVASVMAIARQIAAGLQAAHEAGVVHRDLKPANVMIEKDQHATIMDFGIARGSARAEPRTTSGATPGQLNDALDEAMTRAAATVAGAVVGTIEYMAPEQARGEDVDQRADIYAFGLILYDMLAGRRRAEHAGSAIADLQNRMQRASPPVKTVVPAVPEPLNQLVTRCIEPDAAKRFQSTAELVTALDRLDHVGKLKPIRKVVGLGVAAAVAIVLLSLSGGIWWYTRPPVVRDPLSVVIADLDNRTGDPAFDGTLEPMLRRALSEAAFITAYDRNGVRSLGVQPPERLNEAGARDIALKQGLDVVVSGSLEPRRDGYRISVKAIQTVSGDVIASPSANASDKDQVLEAATRLMIRVRNALGDDTSESAQQFAGNQFSTTSLDVVRLYAASIEAQSNSRLEEALEHARKTVELDPNFGVGYMIAAAVSANLGRLDDQRKYLDEAVTHLGGMTERERYMTRAYSYLAANDYEPCVKEYTEAVVRYRADVIGRNNLAVCLSKLRRLREAMVMVQEIVNILPRQPVYRANLAFYASYDGDFQTAEQQARAVEGPDLYATLALALAQLGQGQLSQARDTYEKLRQIGTRGASFAASGLGDVAILEGRFSEAVDILRRGVSDDVASENAGSASAKLTAIAYAELSRGRNRAAIEAADEALRHSKAVTTRFLAARTFVEADDAARARSLIDSLAKEPFAEPQAYAKIVEGVLALNNGDAGRAVTLLREANDLFDTWIGLFDLGRASLEAGLFTQADSAFDTCLNARRGEALSLFLDEEPTYAYLAPVHYYLGRTREAQKITGYAESYGEYQKLRGKSKEDLLLPEVHRRAGL